MKKASRDSNYCDVSLHSKDRREQQIKRVICEAVDGEQYTIVLVPKHDHPDILGICNDHNLIAKMDENQLTMKQIEITELPNKCVRVIIPNFSNLEIFLRGLLNVQAISKGDDKKTLSMCNRVKIHQQSQRPPEETEENSEDEHRPFIPTWTSKNM